MADKMNSYKPAQIFASITTDPPEVKESKTKQIKPQSSSAPTNNNEVQVSAVGELSLLPDRCKISLHISSRKDQVQEVKNSVQRRLDYVLQTLHNHQIMENDIHVTKVLVREDSLYVMSTEITVQFTDFNKCQSVSNLLVEKLDDSVNVTQPHFYHSPQRLDNLRKQASLIAVKNAKQKAGEIAQFLHAKVGQSLAIREDYCNEWEGPLNGSADMDAPITVQQRITQATINTCVKVTATFELKSRKSKEMKNN